MIPWDPKLIVMNIDGAFVLNRKTYDVRFNEQGRNFPVVIQLWRFKGFFKENLELEHFPVDVQVIIFNFGMLHVSYITLVPISTQPTGSRYITYTQCNT